MIKPDLLHIDNVLFNLEQSNLEDVQKILEIISINLKKIILEEKDIKNRDFSLKYKQIKKDTMFDIEDAKQKSLRNSDEITLIKALQELSQIKLNYLELQDQYNSLLNDKLQISSDYLQNHTKITDELFMYIKQISEKLQSEEELRTKIILESKNIRNSILNKSVDRDQFECNCNEEVKALQKKIREINEDRKKIIEKLETCINENRTKEEHIHALNSASNSYEQETQHLSSVISDYENLIYELRKSLNSMSSKISHLEEEKLIVSQENDRLRNHYKIIKEKIDDQKLITEKEILKYKQETDECSIKYENVLAKIESLTLEVSKLKLTNSHLKIQNRGLEDDLGMINYNEIDKKIKRVYEKFEKFEELTKTPVLFDNM